MGREAVKQCQLWVLNIAMSSSVICGVHHWAYLRLLEVEAHLICTLRKWITVRKREGKVKEFLTHGRERGRGEDREVSGELVSLHLPGIWGIQKRKHWVMLLAMDPSPAPAASVCLHQVCWLFLELWHNKSRQQGQGHFAVPRVLLPWRAIYLGHDESQAKLNSSKAATRTILCSCINIKIVEYPKLEGTTKIIEVLILASHRTHKNHTMCTVVCRYYRCDAKVPNICEYLEGLHKESDRDTTLNTSNSS